MIDYTICYKKQLPIDQAWTDHRWDFFVSAYTEGERILRVFDRVEAGVKEWVVFPEYGFKSENVPKNSFQDAAKGEAEFIRKYIDNLIPRIKGGTLCIDITGFIRPHLMVLVQLLFSKGVNKFDVLYSEPVSYIKKELTTFSSGRDGSVRQVHGFEGAHSADTTNDLMIVGSGYDTDLIARVAAHKETARRVQLFGLPSLRADMYQENVLKAAKVEDMLESFFAPANDPFVTADKLREIVQSIGRTKRITNLYLAPLASKVQVLGFALFFLFEKHRIPTSILYPFTESYSKETSVGLSRAWKYTVEKLV